MDFKPTEGELDILNILWKLGPSSVREVHEVLAISKEVGYTTTLKMMQIMYEKGMLQRDASTRSHIYTAVVNQQSAQQQMLRKMIDTVFGGNATQLVLQALGHHQTSAQELESIKEYLNNLEQNK